MTRLSTALLTILLLISFVALTAGCGDDAVTVATAPTPVPTSVAPHAGGGSTSGETPPVGAPVLVAGGSSFGECGGFCWSEVTVDGADIELRLETWGEAPPHTMAGTLTAAGEAAVADAARRVDLDALEEVYGCPDCADGGASWLVLHSDEGRETRSSYEFGLPPEQLADLDAVVSALTATLRSCAVDDLVAAAGTCRLPPDL